jgi:acyl-coenzyme A thioesterase PaaI-like protein
MLSIACTRGYQEAGGDPMTVARPSEIPGALATSGARRDVARQLRTLADTFLSHEADDETLAGIARALAGATESLAAGPARARSFDEIRREPEADEVPDGEPLDHFDQCFVTGEASPVGLAARVRRAGDGLVLTTRFPRAFEGMPGYAHGGIVAAVFDDVIGLTMGRLHRVSAPTVHVEVDFRRPVPLDVDVRFRTRPPAGDGRKRTVTAEATVDGVVHAQASALLLVLSADSPLPTGRRDRDDDASYRRTVAR